MPALPHTYWHHRRSQKDKLEILQPMIDLSIIIASYNTRLLLLQCIESIHRHTKGITFEVICIDGNSPDQSAKAVADQFPSTTLIRNERNESYARSVNQGLAICRGRYACLLDSDTLLIENSFRLLVEYMDSHSDAAACGPKLLNPDGSVQHHIRHFAGLGTFALQTLNWHKIFPNSQLMSKYYATAFDFSLMQQVEAIGTTSFVMRRSTWESAGLLDENFRWAVVDLAYEYSLNKRGYRIFYTPCTAMIHFGSQTANQDVLGRLREQADALIYFADKYDYFGEGTIIKMLVRFGVRARYYSKIIGFYLGSDKRIIKGPGRPSKEQALHFSSRMGGGNLASDTRDSRFISSSGDAKAELKTRSSSPGMSRQERL